MIIDDNFLHDDQKKWLDHIFESRRYKFEFVKSADKENDNANHFQHIVLDRRGDQGSPLKDGLYHILYTFCRKHNVSCSKIFRCTINVFPPIKDSYKCGIHTDHPFTHNQLLIYLNDSSGDTGVTDKSHETVLQLVEPKKYRGFFFKDYPHFFYYPNSGLRKVALFTFI